MFSELPGRADSAATASFGRSCISLLLSSVLRKVGELECACAPYRVGGQTSLSQAAPISRRSWLVSASVCGEEFNESPSGRFWFFPIIDNVTLNTLIFSRTNSWVLSKQGSITAGLSLRTLFRKPHSARRQTAGWNQGTLDSVNFPF